jgi:hypothetical protein
VLALGATLSPLLRDPYDDGFPLSTYPMFAEKRERRMRIAYPLGVTTSGERRILRARYVGTHEVIQAIRIVNDALGRGEAAELCKRIAQQLAGDPELVFIRIVIGNHDSVELVARDELGKEHERARCPVPR